MLTDLQRLEEQSRVKVHDDQEDEIKWLEEYEKSCSLEVSKLVFPRTHWIAQRKSEFLNWKLQELDKSVLSVALPDTDHLTCSIARFAHLPIDANIRTDDLNVGPSVFTGPVETFILDGQFVAYFERQLTVHALLAARLLAAHAALIGDFFDKHRQ